MFSKDVGRIRRHSWNHNKFLFSSFRTPIDRFLRPGQADPDPCGRLPQGWPPPHGLRHRRGGPRGRITERLRDGPGSRLGPGGKRDGQGQRPRHGRNPERRRRRRRGRRHRSVVQPVWRAQVAGESSGFPPESRLHPQLQPGPAFIHHQHQPNKQRHQCQGGRMFCDVNGSSMSRRQAAVLRIKRLWYGKLSSPICTRSVCSLSVALLPLCSRLWPLKSVCKFTKKNMKWYCSRIKIFFVLATGIVVVLSATNRMC